MILHIITDDKFLDKGMSNFNRVFPEENKTMILSSSNHFKYLKLKPDFIVNKFFWFFSLSMIKNLRKAQAIVLHNLSLAGIIACMLVKKDIKIIWIGWGSDYYSLFVDKGYQSYGPYTKALYEKNKASKDLIIKNLKGMLLNFLKTKSINRISFFSPVIYEDYELFLSFFPDSRMKYFPWNYGMLMVENSEKVVISKKNNILIGNSASYTNNHLEIFEILKDVDLNGCKLIVPLSYGNNSYKDQIIKIGYELFGDAFQPLIDFISYEEYCAVLQSCTVAIMNHYRQQALGNVSLMISLGAKVFLSNRNPLYRALGRREIKVFTIEELTNDPASLFVPLTGNEKKQNCINLKNTINQQIIDKQTSDIIAALLVDK